jgi:hypothetical protein
MRYIFFSTFKLIKLLILYILFRLVNQYYGDMQILSKTLKKRILEIFESKKVLSKLKNKFQNKRVLLLGDGISHIYALTVIDQYEYIITVNSGPNIKNYNESQILCNVLMEPNLIRDAIFGRRAKENSLTDHFLGRCPDKTWISGLAFNVNTRCKHVFMHPWGRVLRPFYWKFKSPIYISPYSEFIKQDKLVYKPSSGGAFDIAIGVALLLGFKEIDLAGFDGATLYPRNPLRWYSGSFSPDDQDIYEEMLPPKFLIEAAKFAKIRAYEYRHYKVPYDFIEPISNRLDKSKQYIPAIDRERYFSTIKEVDLLKKWENHFYPNGYNVSDKSLDKSKG